MSRAFVKEGDGGEVEELPDRLISEHPNLVTKEGLAQIEAEQARFDAAHAEAVRAHDRPAIAIAARDLRYWQARRASAEVITPPKDTGEVHFGARITFVRGLSKTGTNQDGRRQAYRIVGEDEADPAKGTLSYVSPLARALMGKSVGEVVRMPNGDEVEIVEIE
jgi:transcription elongation GreA/GreB family factor